MVVTFTVPGEPKGKQRPRVANMNGYARAYTPRQTVNYENWVKACYYEQVGQQQLKPPIAAHIKGVFPIPKSTSKKQRAAMIAGKTLHTKKVDCDNLAKIILDSLNSIAYHDDAGIARLTVEKVYGEQPQVEVTLAEIGSEQDA